MTEPDINACNEPGYIKDLNVDPASPYCNEMELDCNKQPIKESQKDVTGRDFSWLEDHTLQKMGNGFSANCDPMQTGYIVNDQAGAGASPNRNTIYRYSKAFRGCDEGIVDLFRDLVVLDEDGKYHAVPVIWATQEAAVAAIIQENYRKDDSLVVDRVKLPMLAVHSSSVNFGTKRYVYHKAVDYIRVFNKNNVPGFTASEKKDRDTVFGVARGIPVDVGYTLWAWALHREDMNQIVEQIMSKFSLIAYIRVRGVSSEIAVKLDSVANNIEVEPGDKAVNVFKFQFAMTAETYIPQPIVRKKAVLSTRTEISDSINDQDISETITRLEETVKDLHD